MRHLVHVSPDSSSLDRPSHRTATSPFVTSLIPLRNLIWMVLEAPVQKEVVGVVSDQKNV